MADTALKKVKIVSVDRIGFGYSEFGRGEKSLEKQAEYLLPIVQHFKKSGKKLILIGHSLGGPLIARIAMDYPSLIDNLIIVASSISPYHEPNEKWFRIPLNFLPINLLIPKSFKASNLGSEGFEVLLCRMFLNGSVAQLNRALDYGSRGFRFES